MQWIEIIPLDSKKTIVCLILRISFILRSMLRWCVHVSGMLYVLALEFKTFLIQISAKKPESLKTNACSKTSSFQVL